MYKLKSPINYRDVKNYRLELACTSLYVKKHEMIILYVIKSNNDIRLIDSKLLICNNTSFIISVGYHQHIIREYISENMQYVRTHMNNNRMFNHTAIPGSTPNTLYTIDVIEPWPVDYETSTGQPIIDGNKVIKGSRRMNINYSLNKPIACYKVVKDISSRVL